MRSLCDYLLSARPINCGGGLPVSITKKIVLICLVEVVPVSTHLVLPLASQLDNLMVEDTYQFREGLVLNLT